LLILVFGYTFFVAFKIELAVDDVVRPATQNLVVKVEALELRF
jgi:hypothetical protein